MNDELSFFHCSYCEQQIRYRLDQEGQRCKCPKCQKPVILVPNDREVVDDRLTSGWYYQRLRLLKGREDVGPIPDTEFLAMVQKGHIAAGDSVKSPEITKNQWVDVAQIRLSSVSDRVEQRFAERQRRERVRTRRENADRENRQRLKTGIRKLIQTGAITTKHRQQIEAFAVKAGIPETEVQATLAAESRGLVQEVFEEALEDGILEPREEQELSQLAISLGVSLEFTEADEQRIALCRLAYELDSGSFEPDADYSTPFKLKGSETQPRPVRCDMA